MVFGALLLIILLICMFLYFMQDKMIFFPQPLHQQTLSLIRDTYPEAVEKNLEMQDGPKLHGWFVNESKPEEKPGLIFFFGGNAEEVSHMIERVRHYEGWATVLINYRGYGKSEGRPGEKKLNSDALEVYDHFSSRDDIDPEKIVIMGRSLGTGVATHLAYHRQNRGLILISPFTSILSLAQRMFPVLPVKWLLRHPFNSLEKAPHIRTPLFVILGSEDQIVAPKESEKLARHWAGPATVKVIEGEDHNTLSANPLFEEYVKKSLSTLTD